MNACDSAIVVIEAEVAARVQNLNTFTALPTQDRREGGRQGQATLQATPPPGPGSSNQDATVAPCGARESQAWTLTSGKKSPSTSHPRGYEPAERDMRVPTLAATRREPA